MGIKGLKSFLQDNDINVGIDKTNLNSFKKTKLAVDLSILLHRSLYNNSNYISYFVNFTLKLIKYNITPIFVFDGKPPKEKNGVLEIRKKNKDKASKKVSLLLELKNKIDKIYQLTKQYIIIESLDENENDNETNSENDVFISNNEEVYNRYEYLNKKKIFEKLSLHHELVRTFKIKEHLIMTRSNTLQCDDSEIECNLSDSVTSRDSIVSLTDSIKSNDSGIIYDIYHDDFLNDTTRRTSSKSSSISLDSINEEDILDLNLTDMDYTGKYINNLLLNCQDDDNINPLDINIDESHKNIEKDIQKNNNKSKGIKKSYIENLKKLFYYLHVPYIHINKEADIVCKLLIDYNIVDSCISDDMDMIPYQCKSIIQNINFSNDDIIVYNLETILNNLNITNQQLIDLCICCGTDFNNKLINIKCKELYGLIKTYGSIEGIIDNLDIINENREKTLKIPYQFDYQISRDIFMIKDNDITLNYLLSKIKNYQLPDIHNPNEKVLKDFYEKAIQFIKKFAPDWNFYEITTKLNKIYKITFKDNNNFYKFYTKHYGLSNTSVNSKYSNFITKKNINKNINSVNKNINSINSINSINKNESSINKISNINDYFYNKSYQKILDFDWHTVK